MGTKSWKVFLTVGAVIAAAVTASAEVVITSATLKGGNEVPSVSTGAQGLFIGVIDTDNNTIQFTLIYTGLESSVTQAHIHFGQEAANGGIMAFLCTNLGNGPAGTEACPASGTVSGTLTAQSIVGPEGQGIATGEMAEAIRAIRNGLSYANVHSQSQAAGEIRGQLR